MSLLIVVPPTRGSRRSHGTNASSISYHFICRVRDTWISHGTNASSILYHLWIKHVTHEGVMPQMLQACLTYDWGSYHFICRVRDVIWVRECLTYDWGSWHMKESCHRYITIHHSLMNKARHIYRSHITSYVEFVTHESVMAQMHHPYHITYESSTLHMKESYEVATISRLIEIIGYFCKTAL